MPVRTIAPSIPKGRNSVANSRKPLLETLSSYAKKIAGVLGFAAVTGVASASPMHADATHGPSFRESPAPFVPVPKIPGTPRSAEGREKEWKTVIKKGQGAQDFALEAFGTRRWERLVDQEGNRLSDSKKLRLGRSYSLGSEKGAVRIERTERTVRTPSAQPSALSFMTRPSMDVEAFISYAREHLWKPYRLWGNGTDSIDCSQLVVEALKKGNVVPSGFDATAAKFHALIQKKKVSNVERWDLVFLKNPSGHVSHVAIALSAPDEKGYVRVTDAAKSQKAVTDRKFHVSIISSAGTLPVIARSSPSPSSQTLVASKAPAVSKVSSASDAPAQSVSKKTQAKVIELVSKIPDKKFSQAVTAKLSERSMDEQIAHYRSQAKAANDPYFAASAEKTALQLELTQLLARRDLVLKNIALRNGQLKEGHAESPRVLANLERAGEMIDDRIRRMKWTLNDLDLQMRRAA